jgi:UDP-glucose 4-epimerase
MPDFRAVVTGAGGFIGRALVRALAKAGVEVCAVDRREFESPASRVLVADLAEPGLLTPLLDARTVLFHLAASADVAGSVRDPRTDFECTFRPLFEALESARAARSRVVYPSTASVYEVGNSLPLVERAFPRPTSPYAAAKLAGEAYCFAYHRSYGLDTRVVRLFSVYGPGMTRFAIHDIVRRIEADPTRLTILGDGEQIRDYLHIDDAVRGLIAVAERGAAGEDYNLATGIPVKLRDLARTVGELMGAPEIEIVPSGESFPGDTPRWFADTTKVSALGFRPEVELEAGLRETIAWLRAAGR